MSVFLLVVVIFGSSHSAPISNNTYAVEITFCFRKRCSDNIGADEVYLLRNAVRCPLYGSEVHYKSSMHGAVTEVIFLVMHDLQ